MKEHGISLGIGQTVRGRVIGLQSRGVLLDLGDGRRGYLHRSQVSWQDKRVKINDTFTVGDELDVIVLDVRYSKKTGLPFISVGHRQVGDDPWEKVEQLHPIGSRTRGTVVEFLPFGALVEFETGFQALVHDSEISWTDRRPKAHEFFSLGTQVDVAIQLVDKTKRKIHASYREANDNPWNTFDEDYPRDSTAPATIVQVRAYGSFLSLANGCVGLLHHSQYPKPTFSPTVGQSIQVKILDFDRSKMRIALGYAGECQRGDMQQSQFASRLTLFAILSSIEGDLRACFRDHVLNNPSAHDAFPADIRKKLVTRHQQNHTVEEDAGDDTLLEFADFADSYELLRHHKSTLPADIASELDVLFSQLSSLAAVRNRVMHSRPLEPDDFVVTYDFSRTALSGKSLRWPELTLTMRRLEDDPSYVLTLKLPELLWDDSNSLPHNLPLPEFDDTGFIGRVKDRDDLTKLILGHHQIVTILGEGGVGKTATLIKCLYDLLDTATGRFDTIVWISLKNQVLTAAGIKSVRNAVTTTLGLYQALLDQLGAAPKRETITNVLDDLRACLEQFRVLLAIDNLETLQHNELLEFLRDLPATTKVVITSRIGLGELEIRRPLLPMNDIEAAQLFRRFTQVHRVDSLKALPHADIIKICRQLHSNPLAIRWFLTSVQQGTPPQQLLTEQTDLLEFCVENVYDKLSSGAKLVLGTLLGARKPLAEAEVAYLMDMTAVDVRRYIFEIVGTMMVRVEQKKLSDSSLEAQYALTEFSRRFLELHHKPPAESMQQVTRKLAELSSAVETAGMYRDYDAYDHRAIFIRSANDRAPARLLQQALVQSARKNYAAAITLTNQAKALNPTYPEIYKIAAFVKAHSNDYLGAQEDYEHALQLAPESPQTLYFYSGFHAYDLNDSAGALELIERAREADPGNKHIKSRHARILTFLGRLEDAWTMFEGLIENMEDETPAFQIKMTDAAINCLHRIVGQKNGRSEVADAWSTGLQGLGMTERAMVAWPTDRKFRGHLMDLVHDLTVTCFALRSKDATEWLAKKVLEHHSILAMQEQFGSNLTTLTMLSAEFDVDAALIQELKRVAEQYGVNVGQTRFTGIVCRCFPHRKFGYVRCDDDGVEYYFSYAQLGPAIAWKDVQVDARLSFCLGRNHQGPCAVSLMPCM